MISRRVLGLAVAASVLFGGTFVAVKAGLDYFPPLLFVALRFDIAALALAVYVLATRSRADLLPRTRGDLLGIGVTGLLAIGLTNALLFVGQQSATSAVAAIVFSLNPILTPVFAALLLSTERLSRRGAVGMVVGLLGVALVVDPDPAMLADGGLGQLVLFVAAVAAALGSVLIRWADSSLSSTVRVAWALPLASALNHGLSVAAGESITAVVWTVPGLLALGYVGVFAGAVAYIAYFGLLDEVGAIRANLVFYVVPAVSTLGGWALLDETIPPTAVVGFLTIFVGFAVIGSDSVDRRRLRPGYEPDVNHFEIDGEVRAFEAD
ncbi:DMT family transporter [Haloarcula sp. GH36]|uniref:DMT family transporter n=1 Tax=Haloarcula montana TaxID=3111776 RepID=UPI002D794DF4|nr:DMT family transporter [Haloarcula sp. GH36]